MSKTLRRENRTSGGTRAKVNLIVSTVRAAYPKAHFRNGGDIFAAYRSLRSKGSR